MPLPSLPSPYKSTPAGWRIRRSVRLVIRTDGGAAVEDLKMLQILGRQFGVDLRLVRSLPASPPIHQNPHIFEEYPLRETYINGDRVEVNLYFS